MSGGNPHVVCRTFIAERERDRRMDLELFVPEGDLQLIQRRAPFMAPVRHRTKVGRSEMASAIGGIGRWGDRRGIGGPHCRGGHCVRSERRLGFLDARAEPREPGAMRPRMRQENALDEAEGEIGPHLRDALQRSLTRL
jgi:hypothetical protein